MKTFVLPDIHGKAESLRSLLFDSGVDIEARTVVSIGDLCNAVLADANGDEECLQLAEEFIDVLILGNHEAPYILGRDHAFSGYADVPPVSMRYRELHRKGKVVPCMLVGETLLTHAGVHRYFNFGTAAEACDAIIDVWMNSNTSDPLKDHFSFTVDRQPVEIPKFLLLEGVGPRRGGGSPLGGILWADWSEPKNTNFSQIVGHTPMEEGPVLTSYDGLNVFTLNIDCAAKKGLPPTGVLLDEEGKIERYVRTK